jgi:hypothetical protein
METFKLIFITFFLGSNEVNTLYIRGNEFIIQKELKDYEFTYWTYFNYNKNSIKKIDSDNNFSEELISNAITGGWIAYPPLNLDIAEELVSKEIKDGKLHVKTKSKFNNYEYILERFPLQIEIIEDNFFNFSFDKDYPLIASKFGYNLKNQETESQRLVSIENITEKDFNEMLSKFSKN